MIKKDSLYLFRHNSNCWIVSGESLQDTMETAFESGEIIIEDIGGNFYQGGYNEGDFVSYQELYRIKNIELA